MNDLKKYVKDLICDKSVCILGFGREGKSTYKLFSEIGGYKELAISDAAPLPDIEGARTITGADYQKELSGFDIIMKSPGIVLEKGVLDDLSSVYSQTEIFLSVYRENVIGVTGTKGKSTTTTLIYHVLEKCGKKPVLLGNIGIPPFDGGELPDSPIVLELSSHQLEYTDVSPHIAVFLNVFPEHLDHYASYEGYYNAKKNIYLAQKEGDLLIAGLQVAPENHPAELITFGKNGDITITPPEISFDGETLFLGDGASPLIGDHNLYNIAAAYAVCRTFGISKDEFLSAIRSYKPLSHRLENIGTKDGITYYDDSISTIPQSTIQALLGLKNVSTLLVGGMDRGIDYSPLVEFLSTFEIENVIFMYESGKRVLNEFEGKNHIFKEYFAEDLKEAVALAKKITKPGTICLLSPAAASYGYFKNFEERGDKFKEYALQD